MPNWMYNYLSITGEESAVQKLVEQVSKPNEKQTYDFYTKKTEVFTKESAFSFWNIIAPTDLEAYNDGEHNPKQEGEGHWYRWNIENWGTKWDCRDVEVTDRADGSISYRFATPWGVPLEALTRLSEQYPDLDFSLDYEEEQGWGGSYEIKDGLVVISDEFEYKCFECESKFTSWSDVKFDDDNKHLCERVSV